MTRFDSFDWSLPSTADLFVFFIFSLVAFFRRSIRRLWWRCCRHCLDLVKMVIKPEIENQKNVVGNWAQMFLPRSDSETHKYFPVHSFSFDLGTMINLLFPSLIDLLGSSDDFSTFAGFTMVDDGRPVRFHWLFALFFFGRWRFGFFCQLHC